VKHLRSASERHQRFATRGGRFRLRAQNLIKMIEMVGGDSGGEAGDGLTAIAESTGLVRDIVLMDTPCRRWKGLKRGAHRAPACRCAHRHGFFVGYQENIWRPSRRARKHLYKKPVKPEVLYEILGTCSATIPTPLARRWRLQENTLMRWN